MEDIAKISKLKADVDKELASSILDKEMSGIFEVFITILDEFKKEFNNKVEENSGEIQDQEGKIVQMREEIGKLEERLKILQRNELTEAIDSVKTLLTKKISHVEEKIPSPIDLSMVESNISELEKKVSDIPKQESIEKAIESNLPKFGDKFRDGLELLPQGEKLAIQAIEDLPEILDELKKQKTGTGPMGGGITGRDIFKDIDISAQLNGVTKTFNIPAIWNVISIDLSSFPYALRKGVDYTWTTTSITFTDQIDAASSLATGQTCILTVVT